MHTSRAMANQDSASPPANPLPSWSLVVTTKAPAALVKAFIAHHLLLGASELFVFFDDPQDPAFDAVKDLPQVRATRCDASYWAQRKSPRPQRHQQRQVLNANLALKSSSADWLGHIDIDEFLHPATSVAAMLGSIMPSAGTVRLLPCENMFRTAPSSFRDAFAGPFKKPLGLNLDGWMAAALVYGDLAKALPNGLQGHFEGKIFLRKGAELRFGNNHYANYRVAQQVPDLHDKQEQFEINASEKATPAQQDSVLLLHFFVLGYQDWCDKYLRRLKPGGMAAQNPISKAKWNLLKTAIESGESAVQALFERMNLLTASRLEVFQRMGALVEVDLNLVEKVQHVFGSGDHGFDETLPVMPFDELRATLASYRTATASEP